MLSAITYLSLIKIPTLPPLQDVAFADKWGHMLAYAVWAACIIVDCLRAHVSRRSIYIITPLFTIAYGGLMELMQHYFFPPRTGEWLDWLADSVGVAAVLVMCAIAEYIRGKKMKTHA